MDRDRGGGRAPGLETEPVATPVTENTVEVRQSQADTVARRDSARWGPIWAGLITAITTFLLLELLALGTGLFSINLDPNSVNQANAWVSAVIGLIAFFTGGSVAGMTSAVRGTVTGLLNGFLVWALGTVLILVPSALGLGQVFGALGNVIGQFNLIASGSLNVPGVNVDPQQLLSAIKTGALMGFFSLLISAAAAALGGWLGGRTDEPSATWPTTARARAKSRRLVTESHRARRLSGFGFPATGRRGVRSRLRWSSPAAWPRLVFPAQAVPYPSSSRLQHGSEHQPVRRNTKRTTHRRRDRVPGRRRSPGRWDGRRGRTHGAENRRGAPGRHPGAGDR